MVGLSLRMKLLHYIFNKAEENETKIGLNGVKMNSTTNEMRKSVKNVKELCIIYKQFIYIIHQCHQEQQL